MPTKKTEKKAEKNAKDYIRLRDILESYSFVFCKGDVMHAVYSFLLDASLRFDRVYVDLYPKQIKLGYPKFSIPPVPWSRRIVWNTKRLIRDRGLIFYRYNPGKQFETVRHVINVTGMMRLLEPVIKLEQYPTELVARAAKEIRELGFDPEYPIQYEEDRFMKIEEAIEEANKKSKAAIVRKNDMVRMKKDPTSTDVAFLIKEFCKKYDMKATGTSTVKSRNKMKLWARNYSANAGVADTWWEHLELIIKYWSRYRGVLIDPDGARSILLPKAFAWDFYFMRPKYATLIDSWIMTYDETEDPVASILENVVDITDYSKLSKKEG